MDYCFTYFNVLFEEDFDLKDFCQQLGLDYQSLKDFANEGYLEVGRNEEYDVDLNVMVRKTLKDLWGKEKILLELKKKYRLKYFLERVVHLYADTKNNVNPFLSLDHDIIAFLYKSGTDDDLDYYVY